MDELSQLYDLVTNKPDDQSKSEHTNNPVDLQSIMT
jgi:hypothetical protein